MVIDRTYFVGDLFVPAMKPSIVDKDSSGPLQYFIDEYSEKCLIECFGFTLYQSLIENLEGDSAKELSDQKWKDLIDGEIVTLSDGTKKRWKGLAYSVPSADAIKNRSFITNYVYFFYERGVDISKSTKGDVKLNAGDGLIANAGYKASIVWNKFVDEVNGFYDNIQGHVKESDFGSYVDWYVGNNEFSLYEYIRYKNNKDSTTYPNFAPKLFVKINQFGI